MGDSQKLSLAFLGCGNATRMHSKTIRKIDGHVARYYASRDADKAVSACRMFGGAGSFESYAAAINDPKIDVVMINTPPADHLQLAVSALQAGKHVIVEKPPFLSVDDLDIVAAAARDADRQLLVAENYYYKPVLKLVRRLLSEDIIGEVVCVTVNALKKQTTSGWRDDSALSGGGALFEGGIHWMNFLANLGMTVSGVHGYFPNHADPQTERSSVVVFEYEEGAVGTLHYSWDVPSLINGVRISRVFGRKGSILFESNGIFATVSGTKRRAYLPGFRDIQGYRGMFRDFFRALRTGANPDFTLDMARLDLRNIASAYSGTALPKG